MGRGAEELDQATSQTVLASYRMKNERVVLINLHHEHHRLIRHDALRRTLYHDHRRPVQSRQVQDTLDPRPILHEPHPLLHHALM